MHLTVAAASTTPEGADMPSNSISTPESTPSVDRLSLDVAATRQDATTASACIFGGCACSASSED